MVDSLPGLFRFGFASARPCRGKAAQFFAGPVEDAEIDGGEADEPVAVFGLGDADGLAGQRFADEDEAAAPFDRKARSLATALSKGALARRCLRQLHHHKGHEKKLSRMYPDWTAQGPHPDPLPLAPAARGRGSRSRREPPSFPLPGEARERGASRSEARPRALASGRVRAKACRSRRVRAVRTREGKGGPPGEGAARWPRRD